MLDRRRVTLCLLSLEVLMVLCWLRIPVANGQTPSPCSAQPVISRVDPPSGSRNTLFAVLGESLDVSGNITVTQIFGGTEQDILVTTNVTQTRIEFRVNPATRDEATITIDPVEEGCESVSVVIFLVLIDSFTVLLGRFQIVQPGSVLATDSTCLPPTCVDNSTSYEVLLAGITLQQLQANSVSFVVRLPDTDMDYDNAEIVIQTFYSQLLTNARVNFRRSPPITSITPNRGQRGTRVVIEGQNLLGFGQDSREFSQVLIGSTNAGIDSTQSNSTHIFARVASGTAGSNTVAVNTTQTLRGVEYDGPYTFSDSLWTQLEDGLVSEIIPPAAQINATISLCGERLLGGGSGVASITLAREKVEVFGDLMQSEGCIEVRVPYVLNPEGATPGRVTLESDTGAIVESPSDIIFTYAVITNISPSAGQVGTEVTISGIGLLSGYPDLSPSVFLSGTEATVTSSSSENIVIRVQNPEIDSMSGSASGVGSGGREILGDTVITVTRDDTEFSVSLAESWEYLDPSVIELVVPDFGQFGTRITLTGTNLLGYGTSLREVRVDGSPAVIVSQTNSEVVIDAPDIQTLGRVSIVLEANNGALVSLDEAFEYRERGTIMGLDPASGQNGTFVLISGSNLFGHARNITSITFGGVEADIDFTNSINSLIRVRVQPNDVTIDTPVLVVITAATMARVSTNGNDWMYLVPGRVNDVEPSSGQAGTVVTITGTNLLGGGSGVQSICLDGVSASVIEDTPTSITVAMGQRCNLTQPMDFYPRTVYILADTGAVIVGGAYTHLPSGEITNFSPTVGREGTRITITGTNLPGYGARVIGVMIAGVQGEIVEQADASLVVVRAGAAQSGTVGNITLTSDTGAFVTSQVNFTYSQQGSIDEVNPSKGAEGSGVLIQGTFLRPVGTVVTSVTIGGSPVLRIVTESESEVAVVVGAAPENGNNSIIVITANDGSIVRGGNFTYLDLTLSLPDLDHGQQGTRVTIRLPNDDAFDPSLPLVARIGGQIAMTLLSSVSNQSIEVITPRAGEVGTYSVDVTVEGIDGRVARLRNGFTYIQEGVVFTVTPDSGQQGTRIQVVGRNLLGGGTTIQSAHIGPTGGREVSANVIGSNDERIDLEILANFPLDSVFPITTDITLVADTGATTVGVGLFTLVQPGVITGVSPPSGQFGTRVTITGINLLQGGTVSSITLAGEEVDEILGTPTDTAITVRALQGALGSVIITLMTGATIITPGSITFQYLSPGVIGSVSPDSGTVGTMVTISGDNLLGGGLVQEVSLGGQPAETIGTPTTTQIIVRAGQPEEGVSGSGEGVDRSGVVEILINTGALISGGEWEFEDLGEISSFDPPIGQQGVTVTISGDSLLGSSATVFSSCSLAGIPGTVTRSTDTEAECVAGFNPSAADDSNPNLLSGPVELVADSGPVIVSEEQFTYYVARIDNIEPANGTNGTYVDISGINLIGSAESGDFDVDFVRFGSIDALAVEVLTRNRIRVRVGPSSANSGLAVRLQLASGAFLQLDNAWEYSEPGEILDVSPLATQPGETVTVYGQNLVPPCVSEILVIVGQTRSYEATVVNSTEVTFRPGPYQASVGADSNLDEPGMPLPIQVIASNGATVYTSMGLFMYNQSDARVTSISPIAGSGGTRVTIRGENLLYGSSMALVVTLTGQNAAIDSASDSEVIVIAGDGPTEGAQGRIIIESENGLVSGIGTDDWQYLPDITADDVTPQTGQEGTRVSIDLKGISLEITRITLAGVEVNDIVSVSEERVVVRAGASPQTSVGDITIEFEDGVSLTIPSAWSYLEPAQVDTLTPNCGYFNTEFSIRGSNLRAGNRDVTSVEVEGIATEIVSQGDSEFQVRISEFRDSSAGQIEGPVTITWEDGAMYTSGGVVFTYVQLEVRDVSPQSGQGGTRVSITGVGLLAGSSAIGEASLGDVAVQNVSLVSVSDTQIDLIASPSTEGTATGNIIYVVEGGGRVVVEDAWSYLEPGEVREVSPLQAVEGAYVTIRGVGMLQGGSSVSQVTVAGVDVMEVVVGLDDIVQVRIGQTPILPQGAITIESDTGATLSTDSFIFQYLASGSITNVLPASGQNGTRVEISGTGFIAFGEVIRVSMAGVDVNVVEEMTNTSIIVEAGRPDIFEEFTGEIIIETDSGAIITGDSIFTYRQEGVIYSGYPSQGQVGTRVEVSGERLLGGGTHVERAYLAGIEATVDSSSANSVILIASTPPISDSIRGDIVLVSETGAYVRKIDGWTYVMTGAVMDIDPPEGQFGTRVTITGMGLLSGGDSVTQITVGDIATTSDITFSSDTRVEARMGEPTMLNSSMGSVTLISNFGGQLQSFFMWNYLEASIARFVNPGSGVGGAEVTVMGERLLGGGSRIVNVTTAGVPAEVDQGASNDVVMFTVGYHPNGAAVEGNIVIESDTGALTIFEDRWRYEDACPVGQYGSFGNCMNCSDECLSCTNGTNEDCLECRSFMIPLVGSNMRCVERCPNVSNLDMGCVDTCNQNQYGRTDSVQNTVFCYECNSLCDSSLGCTGPNATECTGCAIAFDQDSQACVAACEVGTWLREDRVCVPCDSQCNATTGCFGESASDCYECLNVRMSLSSGESGEIGEPVVSDVCLERCPTGFYEDSNRNCFPCSDQCLGGCTGPTAFDCSECASVARIQDSEELCVPSCNSGLMQNTLFENRNRGCDECSRLCSLEDGCRGPTDTDCITCRQNTTTNSTLPRFEGACVLSCPNTTYYHDTMTGACELCDSSCTVGCRGPTPAECLVQPEDEETDAVFSASPGTIGLTVGVTLVLAVALAALLILIFVSLATRRRGYKLNLHRGDAVSDVEMEVRYSRRPNNVLSTATSKTPIADSATVSADDEYTQMSPTKPVAPTLKRNQQAGPVVRVEEKQYQKVHKPQDSDTTMIENEGAVYSEAGPEAPNTPPPPRPAKPVANKVNTKERAKPTKEKAKPVKDKARPPSKKGQRASEESKSKTAPPPVIPMKPPIASPSKTSNAEKKPAPPPPTDIDGEMYTDMTASVQEVYVQPDPGPTEEYTEMAHIPREEEQLYEDTAMSEPVSPQKSTSDTVPLIDDTIYEDTDETVISSDYQRIKQNVSTASLPGRATPVGAKPFPRSRSAQPLPQTPLEISLQGVKPLSIQEDLLYEETEANALPKEETLYEAIVMTNHLLPDEPSPELAPKERGKGSANPPLPPKGRK